MSRGLKRDEELEQQRNRALADPSRRRILGLLSTTSQLSIRELAEKLDLHDNTIRAHIKVLDSAGLITSDLEHSHIQGRPRRLYRSLSSAGDDHSASDRTAVHLLLLSELLARTVDQLGSEGSKELTRVAESWGRRLVDTSAPITQREATEQITLLTDLLTELGFDPEIEHALAGLPDDDESSAALIAMTTCPYKEVAVRHPTVVCPMHLGMLRGAISCVDPDDCIHLQLEPFARPDACLLHVIHHPKK